MSMWAVGTGRVKVHVSDALLAAGCFLVALALLLTIPGAEADSGDSPSPLPVGSPGWWATVATVVVQAVAVTGVHRFPRVAPIAVVAIALPLAALTPGSFYSVTNLAVLTAVYLVGVRLERRPLARIIVVVFLLVLVGTTLDLGGTSPATPLPVLGGIGQALIVVGTPLLIALVVANRRETRESHRREVAALERERHAVVRERDALVASAIATERTSVARDLHDIAAHHMSGIAMLAAALEREIDSAPASAKDSARDIRAQSTAVLSDLRRLVGLLRDDDTSPLADRSLASFRQLVDERRASGADISLMLHSEESELGEGISAIAQLVGYRMVQEALANATVHAPGAACTVLVGPTGAHMRIEVRNGPSLRSPLPDGSRQGFGLVGMRERAELVGAALDFGPAAEGGWVVRLDLPRDDSNSND